MKFSRNKFVLVILTLVFILRVPSLFEPYWYGDEGIYLTLGEAVRQGLVLYQDIHDNKPPFLYLLAALTGSLFWFRFLLLGWILATAYLFFRLVRNFFPGQEKLTKILTIIFALLSSLPLIEANIANAEIFMLLPTLAAVLVFFAQKPTFKSYFSVGLLFSLATLFKIPAGFDFLALLIFLAFFSLRKKFLITNYYLLITSILGFFLPILATVIYFWSQGALNQYLTAAFSQNLPYLSSWQTGTHTAGPGSAVLVGGILLFSLLFVFWGLKKRWLEIISFIFIWFAFSLFAATLSGRPYPHYLIQILPTGCLLLGVIFQKNFWPKIMAFSLLGTLILAVFYFRFWKYPNFSYYQNFLSFVLGQKTQEDYFRNFNPKVPQTYKLAQFLAAHTLSWERVFIWGDSPVVYALSRRLPVGRYTASYHIIDFEGDKETLVALEKEKPRFIIDLNDEPRPFPELKSFLSQNYLFFQKIEKAEIFRLAPEK